MRHAIGATLAVAFLLAGCGGTAAPASAPTVTVTAEPTGEQTPEPAETPEPTDTTEATTTTSTPGQKSPRGNIIKAIGEAAGVTNEAGETVWTFVVTNIEVGFKCNSGIADPPKNGHYVAIHIESETTAALADDPYDTTVTFFASEFTVFDSDGKRENDSEGNAHWCVSSDMQMPGIIGPAEKAEGVVVLDTSHDTGTIVFQPGALGGAGGWEWEY